MNIFRALDVAGRAIAHLYVMAAHRPMAELRVKCRDPVQSGGWNTGELTDPAHRRVGQIPVVDLQRLEDRNRLFGGAAKAANNIIDITQVESGGRRRRNL